MKVALTEFQTVSQDDARSVPTTIDKKRHAEPQPIQLSNPLGQIALCMSGGGFRAASFALGTLAFLDSVQFMGEKLSNRVCYISSASGGTITASLYALARNNPDYDFQQFYTNTLKMLKGEKLLEAALTNLNNKKLWTGSKNRNLINAFAKAY
ncbi:MAG TPA: patatin-like phospholipase family protein, partial [Cyclobacteriaceae bacterium]|nr:patatin-like phospholipase family protein [Cyclobacteriaceae bacterium]